MLKEGREKGKKWKEKRKGVERRKRKKKTIGTNKKIGEGKDKKRGKEKKKKRKKLKKKDRQRKCLGKKKIIFFLLVFSKIVKEENHVPFIAAVLCILVTRL